MKITFGILAHVDAGKTTFSEQILYREGVIRALGRVDAKNACMDHDDIERARGITIFSDMAGFTHGDDTYYLIDTPGHTDFSAEMERVLEIMDYAVLMINGSDGIQGHTEAIWSLLERYNIPVFLFINKLDVISASYERALSEVREHFSCNIMDFQDISLRKGCEGALPDDFIENVSEWDESLLDEWLNGTITFEDLRPAVVSQIKNRRLFPCFGGCALNGEGIQAFLETFYCFTEASYPVSAPFSGRVFKIRYDGHGERMTYLKILSGFLNVRDSLSTDEKVHQIRVFLGERFTALQKASAGDVVAVTGLRTTRAGQGLGECCDAAVPVLQPTLQAKVLYPPEVPDRAILQMFYILEEEEPALSVVWEESLRQLKVNIMGKIQLEVLEQVILDRFQIKVAFGQPEIIYTETIAEPVTGYGHFEPLRHYAEVALRIEPNERGKGILFESQCHVDRLGINYQNLVRTHVFETIHKGVLTGSELTDVKIVLVDGISHIKHTEGGDFREAVYRAIRQGLMKARSVLLEPYYSYTISIPDHLTGRVLNDITRYSGRFEAPVPDGSGRTVIRGLGPVASFMNYGEELMIKTGGKGSISMVFSHYDLCHNQDEVLNHYQYNPNEDTDNPSCSVFCQKGTSFVVNWDHAEEYMHTLR
ncbi:TetM/TetW/TetO/TetS family tetracycline resistance ribosomal protection protein [Lacrimispora sp.]|uniref:TetM/TetW/TetO/TetS family tetracycline resistance ribosomal protection protein n=1 Tax=Lacrimispora sp. TaxID=2719234 RepID=UPI0028A2DB56|nr:TetM/TetW/TetO/TetS family tetracycline resistance ribosomal protection protein [Lacrimispora sp.]